MKIAVYSAHDYDRDGLNAANANAGHDLLFIKAPLSADTARQAAGYTEAIDLIAGRLSLPAAIDRTKTRTRQLAKRQLTWLRSFHDAIWIPA